MFKILIAEDEEPIANLIRMNLTKAGYFCTWAADGNEAADYMQGALSCSRDSDWKMAMRLRLWTMEEEFRPMRLAALQRPSIWWTSHALERRVAQVSEWHCVRE